MFANRLLIRRQVDTIDFVAGDIAVQPLESPVPFPSARRPTFLATLLQFRIRQIACAGDFPLDHILGHDNLTSGHGSRFQGLKVHPNQFQRVG